MSKLMIRSRRLVPLAVAACLWLDAAEARAAVRDVCRTIADQDMSKPFEKGLADGRVTFVGAHHSVDPQSETFKLIERVLSRREHDVVLVESAPDEGASAVVNEAQHAFRLATDLGVPVIAADLSEASTRRTLAQLGVSELDVVGSLTLRHIRAKAQVGRYDAGRFSAQVSASLRQMQEGRAGEAYTLEDFLRWYRTSYGVPAAGDPDFPRWGRPCAPGRAGQVLALVTNARNVHLAGLIRRELERGRKVLVVFGAGHYFPLQRAF